MKDTFIYSIVIYCCLFIGTYSAAAQLQQAISVQNDLHLKGVLAAIFLSHGPLETVVLTAEKQLSMHINPTKTPTLSVAKAVSIGILPGAAIEKPLNCFEKLSEIQKDILCILQQMGPLGNRMLVELIFDSGKYPEFQSKNLTCTNQHLTMSSQLSKLKAMGLVKVNRGRWSKDHTWDLVFCKEEERQQMELALNAKKRADEFMDAQNERQTKKARVEPIIIPQPAAPTENQNHFSPTPPVGALPSPLSLLPDYNWQIDTAPMDDFATASTTPEIQEPLSCLELLQKPRTPVVYK